MSENEDFELASDDEIDSGDSNDEELDVGINVSEDKKQLMYERMRNIQAQFKVFNSNQENQKVADVQRQFPELTEKEILLGLESVNNNELLLMKRFREEDGFLQKLHDMSNGVIKMDKEAIKYIDPKKVKIIDQSSSSSDENDDWLDTPSGRRIKRSRVERVPSDDMEVYDQLQSLHRRKQPRIRLNVAMSRFETVQPVKSRGSFQKTRGRKSHSSSNDSYGVWADSSSSTESSTKEYSSSRNPVSQNNVSARQLRELGWSEARIKAFRGREQNPNQYYYRFNDPGERQETGAWSPQDRCLFLRQLMETGLDYSWGNFSRSIPGRVGYQCSNYYRQLIKEGIIIDDNYYIDELNQLSYRFRHGRTKKSGKEKRVRKHYGDDSEDLLHMYDDENCLPGFIDVMTMTEVVKPTISPYGHVLGYDSWMKLLNREPKNTCPFTKQKLNRRQLVKLTMANIDEYRDKIVQTSSGLYLVC